MDHSGALMVDDMGSFRIDVEVENPAQSGTRREIRNVLIDTGAELSCFPAHVLDALGIARIKPRRLRQADGTVLERWCGFGIVHAAGTFTNDEFIFGENNDLVLLGSRSLEGLNLMIDPVARRLIDAGPMPFAVTT